MKKKFSICSVVTLISILFLTSPASAQLKYKKQEILRLNWGENPGQIGKIERHKTGEAGVYPSSLGIDAKSNFYLLDTVNQRIQIFNKTGALLRTVDAGEKGVKEMVVDEKGNIFLPYRTPEEFYKVSMIKPDGKVIRTKEVWSGLISDGIIYDSKGNSVSAIEQYSPTKFGISPKIIPVLDLAECTKTEIGINYSRIKKHYKKNNIFTSKTVVLIPFKNGMSTHPQVLGVDENGNVFVLYSFFPRPGAQTLAADSVYVYSPDGQCQDDIPVEVEKRTSESPNSNLFKVDNKGNLYQLCLLKNGAHLFKWSR